MSRIISLSIVPVIFTLAGCATTATKSTKIEAAYVSPVIYKHLSCTELAFEYKRTQEVVVRLAEEQDKIRNSDNAKRVAGFTPLVGGFIKDSIQGDGLTSANLARAKGELVAINQSSLQKGCPSLTG